MTNEVNVKDYMGRMWNQFSSTSVQRILLFLMNIRMLTLISSAYPKVIELTEPDLYLGRVNRRRTVISLWIHLRIVISINPETQLSPSTDRTMHGHRVFLNFPERPNIDSQTYYQGNYSGSQCHPAGVEDGWTICLHSTCFPSRCIENIARDWSSLSPMLLAASNMCG